LLTCFETFRPGHGYSIVGKLKPLWPPSQIREAFSSCLESTLDFLQALRKASNFLLNFQKSLKIINILLNEFVTPQRLK
jgi:hypothetical protein